MPQSLRVWQEQPTFRRLSSLVGWNHGLPRSAAMLRAIGASEVQLGRMLLPQLRYPSLTVA